MTNNDFLQLFLHQYLVLISRTQIGPLSEFLNHSFSGKIEFLLIMIMIMILNNNKFLQLFPKGEMFQEFWMLSTKYWYRKSWTKSLFIMGKAGKIFPQPHPRKINFSWRRIVSGIMKIVSGIFRKWVLNVYMNDFEWKMLNMCNWGNVHVEKRWASNTERKRWKEHILKKEHLKFI